MLRLEPITKKNYKAAVALTVNEEQKHFVAPNWYSLLEATFESNRYIFAIYAKEEMVGVIMFSYYPADDSYPLASWWIERLMIDQKQQHKGYGKQALTAGIAWFRKTIKASELRISAVKGNEIAIKLYQKEGFVLTGETVEGEQVLLQDFFLK